jgi:RNA polymerase sigma factor (sigma-70 family)
MTGRIRRDAPLGDDFESTLARARAGDGDAWERLYEALAGRVAGYLRVQGAREPEDITSEVFLAMIKNIGSFSGTEAQFRSWVFVIAHRRLIDERRRNGRRAEVPLEQAPTTVARDDVEQDAASVIGSHDVRALCDRLVPDQRDVLLLRLVADLTIEQAAEVLDKTPGAVKALQRRGLAAIARLTGGLPAPRGVPL